MVTHASGGTVTPGAPATGAATGPTSEVTNESTIRLRRMPPLCLIVSQGARTTRTARRRRGVAERARSSARRARSAGLRLSCRVHDEDLGPRHALQELVQ